MALILTRTKVGMLNLLTILIKKQNKTKQSTSRHGLQLGRLEKKYSVIMGVWFFHRAFHAILVKDRNTGHVIT